MDSANVWMNISTTKDKKRLDQLLVEAEYFETRQKAQAAILAGLIRKENILLTKPGHRFRSLDGISVQVPEHPFVSRGGLKLAAALETFDFSVQDKICLDIGASTGGFTDCLLQNGAAKVYSIDVGYGQFAWKLRQDDRVICIERTNARYLTAEDLYSENTHLASLAVMDVSFISILKIFPALKNLLQETGTIISLIKPQFEARPEDNKKGIVRSPKVHEEVLNNIKSQASELGVYLNQIIPSPIKGKEGNREFLGIFTLFPSEKKLNITEIVKLAHES